MNVWAYALGVCLYCGICRHGRRTAAARHGTADHGRSHCGGRHGRTVPAAAKPTGRTRADRWPDCSSSAFRGHFSPHGSSGPQQQERPSPNSYSPLRQPSSSSSERESCCATTNAGTVFKELNPLLHSELRLAVMSILIGVESADFVFIRQQTGATAGNLSVQLDKLAKANYIEIEKKTFRGQDALHRLPHHRHGTRRLRRIRRGVADLYPEIKRPQETRGPQRQEVPGRNRNYRTHGLPDSAAAPQSDSPHVRTRTGFDLISLLRRGFLLRPTITAYRKTSPETER